MFDKFLERLSFEKSGNRKQPNNSNSQQCAPNTKLAYNPSLVAKLEQENRQLLAVHWKILAAVQNRKPDLAKQLLIEFKDLLVDHLLTENTSLYVYLRHSARMPSSRNAVKSVKSEMDEISRSVMHFLDTAIHEDIDLNGNFIERFKEIGEALTERIEKEEAFVYPNYQPSPL